MTGQQEVDVKTLAYCLAKRALRLNIDKALSSGDWPASGCGGIRHGNAMMMTAIQTDHENSPVRKNASIATCAKVFILVSLVFSPLTLNANAEAQTVSGWRGDGTGRFPQATPPTSWTLERNVVWKTELPGASPASAIVVGGRVFALSDPARLLCVRAADGKLLWSRGNTAEEIGGSEGAKAGRRTTEHNPDGHAGSAAGTPISNGQVVYAAFENGVVAAYDLDGNRKWVRFVETPKTGFGHATSPALVGRTLIVQFRNVVALNAETGEQIWSADLPATHASTVLARIGGTNILIHPSGTILRATDGKILAENLFRLEQSSAVVHDGVVYANENGRLIALRLPASAEAPVKVDTIWETRLPRAQYQIASPVVHRGCIYSVSMNGVLQATDCETGEQVYRQRLPFASRVYASIQMADGRLYVVDQTGKTLVLKAGREYKELATNKLDYHPTSFAFSGKRLYARTYRHLYCLSE